MEAEHVPLAFGSDYPTESPNPFPGLAAAVSREDAQGQPAGGWMPEQKITMPQALAAFTSGAAYAAEAEDRVGSLEPGRMADFVLVDTDPLTTQDNQVIRRTQVLETWISGTRVWVKK
jgi:predicted amidohydrolase YtcJ